MKKSSRRKGHFTFRTAAVLFALSALLELTGVALPAPLFGEFRGGTAALVYHLIYVLLFLALAVGLCKKPGTDLFNTPRGLGVPAVAPPS